MNIEYFGEFGTRLSHRTFVCLDQPGMVWYIMRSDYPMTFYLLLWGGITFVLSFIIAKIRRESFRH